ncbi:hypothetical protein COT99_02870 [Candidatus Falkowbacteria bacterium CG10_big_fil_rev_8_21_14_0_10_43_10]|uniref:Glycosyltransferase 2-like domain-containing protein n=1 Tax=Candidatus Falkowbacteria bacterium CG10_big_fil_rev_8_21_14_0_10_43_10 TaxID=1974567 RepID=A0A2H0V3W7_9BACT|nr:MAG: hypothetical protein COT99_02870 [Candidatus Falkowbacteria bacterium CG10_big_fil_rev_8_21_14_0_10_43_10]
MSIVQKNNLISIIIPVYNKSEELKQCLGSILQQIYKNYEVIIVNDGSTDDSGRIVDEFISKFKVKDIRYKVIEQKNMGSNAARNRGLEESLGEFIIFWDADLVGKPEMLEKMHDALQNNPEASYAYSSFIFGKKKFKLWPFDAEKLKQMPYIHTTSLCRREHFPGWDENIKRLQDWDLWLTMLAQGHTGVWFPEFLFTAQTAHGTMSHWLPKFVYRWLPWMKEVKKYKEAMEIIKKKHKIF